MRGSASQCHTARVNANVTVTASDVHGNTVSQKLAVTQVNVDSVVISQFTSTPIPPDRIEQLVNEGVINIADRADGGDFTGRDTELLMTLASQAALALQNARLFKLAITDGLTDLFLRRHFMKLERS